MTDAANPKPRFFIDFDPIHQWSVDEARYVGHDLIHADGTQGQVYVDDHTGMPRNISGITKRWSIDHRGDEVEIETASGTMRGNADATESNLRQGMVSGHLTKRDAS